MNDADHNRFAIFTLDELLLFANSIRETLSELSAEGSFQSRVGVDRECAERVWREIDAELARRERADPDAYYGRII